MPTGSGLFPLESNHVLTNGQLQFNFVKDSTVSEDKSSGKVTGLQLPKTGRNWFQFLGLALMSLGVSIGSAILIKKLKGVNKK
ncbi:hypothetical protein AZF37_07680 [endosymbiont 'TC1' of Trimyema compressum]|uniref:LPXTG cell wall anchor domain-containing protein n=1 Tax=endosymbiont 'TC1' of Trimyema compressum TaxID=243899 RepID=UPI0007F04BF5|nr:LPXTG cell wall anchor domain-containing protein [endosymbiont 'TC1' of Trimyema compressum]AMP21059.1 hypothetical protein AZF37_07680 [endosymbiont 'TC1' of Trimyema compressum]